MKRHTPTSTHPVRYHALIPAAGNGTRLGAAPPKQYLLLNGKPLLQHAIERLAAVLPLDSIYALLATNDCWFDRAIGRLPGVTTLRCGGKTRAQTVRNALQALTDVARDDWIVIHDAVRPCIDPASLLRLKRELADDAVGGLLAVPVVGTLKRADHNARSIRTEPRDGLWQAQTPQMFRYGLLCDALAQPGAEHATDEAQAIEAFGATPRLVAGSATNIKITYPHDLPLAEAILSTEQRPPDDFDMARARRKRETVWRGFD